MADSSKFSIGAPVALIGGAVGIGIVIYALMQGDATDPAPVEEAAAIGTTAPARDAATPAAPVADGTATTQETPAAETLTVGDAVDTGEPVATADTTEAETETAAADPGVETGATEQSAEAGKTETVEQAEAPAEPETAPVATADNASSGAGEPVETPAANSGERADAATEAPVAQSEGNAVATDQLAEQAADVAASDGVSEGVASNAATDGDTTQPQADAAPATSDAGTVAQAVDGTGAAPVDDSAAEQAAPDTGIVEADLGDPDVNGPDSGTDLAALAPATPQPVPDGGTTPDVDPAPAADAVDAAQPQAVVLSPTVPRDGATTGATAPSFDLVRVDASGNTVVAGSAEPNSEVEILQDGQTVATVTASARGEFVALFDTDVQEQAQSLELASRAKDGEPQVFSESSVIVLGRDLPQVDPVSAAEEVSLPPAVIKATPEAVTVLQPVIGLADLERITLDSISYDNEGEVVLAGRGRPGNAARIYVDRALTGEAAISDNGGWRVVLNDLEAGRYVLRVDEVAPDGTVASRVESPFQRVYLTAENLELLTAEKQVVIQRGDNLWNIARVRYGDGFKYTTIYDANSDQIRDPDLIYPGQIFDVPRLGGN